MNKILALLMLALLGCSVPWAGRGGADETSNGITAQVIDASGTPVRSALVFIRPAGFVAQNNLTSQDQNAGIYNFMTDSLGKFHVDSLAPGDYIVEVRGQTQGISIRLTVEPNDTLSNLFTDTVALQNYSTVSGSVQLPPDATYARVILLGLDRVILTDALGNFELTNVPSGTLTVVALMPNQNVILGESEIEIPADSVVQTGVLESAEADEREWTHGVDLVLNTKASGILLNERLINYPMPLRLRGEQFPIEASIQGSDLRVVDIQGNAIPFVISFWSTADREATVWIKIDSVQPNDSNVVARLRWGRPGTISMSRSDLVFDSNSHWAIVVPLQTSFRDSAGDLRTPVYSTTAHQGIVVGSNGFPPDFSGQGTWFDGVEQGIGIHGLPLDFGSQDYTVEAWIRPETEGGIWLSRDNKSEGNWNHAERAFYLGSTASVTIAEGLQPTQVTHANPNNYYARSRDSVRLNQWVHLALRRTSLTNDTALVAWYINGNPVPTANAKVIDEPDNMRDTLYIASKMFGRAYQGWINQLQISSTARSPAWIAFDAAIQERNSTAVLMVNRF